MEERKIMLNDAEIPRQWYNALADLPGPVNPLFTRARASRFGPRTCRPSFP